MRALALQAGRVSLTPFFSSRCPSIPLHHTVPLLVSMRVSVCVQVGPGRLPPDPAAGKWLEAASTSKLHVPCCNLLTALRALLQAAELLAAGAVGPSAIAVVLDLPDLISLAHDAGQVTVLLLFTLRAPVEARFQIPNRQCRALAAW